MVPKYVLLKRNGDEAKATMQYSQSVPRQLHEEHRATLAVLDRLDALLARHRGRAPAREDTTAAQLFGDLATLIEQEIRAHFAFEEQSLFPLLAERGEADIGALLTEEHEAILPTGERVAALARAARREGFTAPAWEEFLPLAGELIERLVSHVQKEEMALLPLLEDVLDGESDARLAADYAMAR